jgi:cleavage stimulation factor subunit 3
VPTHALEAIWKGYETFEATGSNRQLARKMVEDQRPRYQAARSVYRDRRRKLDGINHAALPLPPGVLACCFV